MIDTYDASTLLSIMSLSNDRLDTSMLIRRFSQKHAWITNQEEEGQELYEDEEYEEEGDEEEDELGEADDTGEAGSSKEY